jgi:hypothetical protein
MTKAEVEQLIQAALEPLHQEIAELREKLSDIGGDPAPSGGALGSKTQHASFAQDSTSRTARTAPLHENDHPKATQPRQLETETSPTTLEPSAIGDLPSAIGDLPSTDPPSAEPERKDFQRFLQRGLEEEQVRYSEERVADKPQTKKGGWNPFRR